MRFDSVIVALRTWLPVCALLTLTASTALSQAPQAAVAADARLVHANGAVPAALAVTRRAAIAIDGKLGDAGWQDVPVISEFPQTDPDEGKPGTERTEVRIVYDDDAIYVGARMFDSQGPSGIRSRLSRRDQSGDADYFQIVLDAFHDHLGRAFFQVNPAGSKFDALGLGNSNPDASWDPVWEAATSIDAQGWTAEFRIPLSQLRFPRTTEDQVWGMQLRRYITRRNETQQWAFWKRTEVGGPSRFGHLTGLRLTHHARSLEILPYVVTRQRNQFVQPGDPFNPKSEVVSRAGADLKYLLTSNLTLSATFNPDFGQVEADPAVVNLSAYETFFPEKRPFFIEGAGIFSFGNFSCNFCSNVSSLPSFYSRRVGRQPQLNGVVLGTGPFVDGTPVYTDVPENSTILGAAKITGRTKAGYSLGLLDAVTRREVGTFQRDTIIGSDTIPIRHERAVEPLSNYFNGRIKKDLLRGNLVVGGIATSVFRSLGDDTLMTQRLSKHAELVGGDIDASWRKRRYHLIGSWEVSSVSGDSLALLRVQTSPTHYFQRPDREAYRTAGSDTLLDSSRTSLRGLGYYMRMAKESGDWNWETAMNYRSPGFEANDMSFLTRADYLWMNANVVHNWQQPTKRYRWWSVTAGAQQEFNSDHDRTDLQFHAWQGGQFANYWFVNTFVIYHPAVLDDRIMRGGPVGMRPGYKMISGYTESDFRKRIVFSGGADMRRSVGADGYGASVYPGVTIKPRTNVNVSVSPFFSASKSALQFIRSVADASNTEFYGRRYIYSTLKQTSLSLNTRVNWTFTPNLTLELVAQPFVSSQHFYGYKQFARTRSLDVEYFGRDAGVDSVYFDDKGRESSHVIYPDGVDGPAPRIQISNPDFTLRSLQGNAVLRWEYRPGSTLFLVWQQSRNGAFSTGDFDAGRDLGGLFNVAPQNIFVIKASYWFSM